MSNAEDGVNMAERLGRSIDTDQVVRNGRPHAITVSAGVPEADQSTHGVQELTRQADRAANGTKKAGRNRLSVVAFSATSLKYIESHGSTAVGSNG